jgi:hypothetical protein
MTHRPSLALVLALAALTTAAALGPSSVVGATGAAKGTVAKSPISIRITLNQSRVVAGMPIKGTAVLTNAGRKTMLVQQCAVDGWLEVGLANKTIPFSPGYFEVECPPSVVLRPGPNRFPVTVLTTYESCLEPGGQSVVFVPKCLSPEQAGSSSDLPPLPAGKYSTKLFTVGLPRHTAPSNSVVVTLQPPDD